MKKGNFTNINKEVLKWAVQESQIDFVEIANRYPEIELWIEGKASPTYKKLETLSKYLHIPFGYMFLEKPPEFDVMMTEFRTICNKVPEISKNLKDTILDMGQKQEWIKDYRMAMGWDTLNIVGTIDIKQNDDDVVKLAEFGKKTLNLSESWFDEVENTYEFAFSYLRDVLEAVGIIVMQNGCVGNNNKRKLNIGEFRAFLLIDQKAPLIFINGNDSVAGKIFSLIHEYFHVLLGDDDIVTDDGFINKRKEQFINKITAEFLIPEVYLRKVWDDRIDVETQITSIAKKLKVSQLALAIKLQDLKMIDKNTVDCVFEETLTNVQNKKKRGDGGPDFYRVLNSKLSKSFSQAVIVQAELGNMVYTEAFKLLGIKGKTYDAFKGRIYKI